MALRVFLFLLSFVCVCPAQAVLLRGNDTDEVSCARAAHYPAVCRLDFEKDGATHRGTGVLIKCEEDSLWILTAKHCVWDSIKRAAYPVKAIFDTTDGRTLAYHGSSCKVPEFGPVGLSTGRVENDIALLKCALTDPENFDIEPMSVCASSAEGLHYDPSDGVSRGEAHIVGYGWHGINKKPSSRGLDTRKRHACTNVIEYKRNQGGLWSLLSCLPLTRPEFGASGVSFSDSFTRSKDSFVTPLMKCEGRLEFRDEPTWSVFPDLTPEGLYVQEQLHPLQGFTQGGDSGGPLIIDQEGQARILGIAAHIFHNDDVKFQFAQFTPVPYFQKWIQDVLGDLSSRAHMPRTGRFALPSPMPGTNRARLSTPTDVLVDCQPWQDLLLRELPKRAYTGKARSATFTPSAASSSSE